MLNSRRLLLTCASLGLALSAQAASPDVRIVIPRGGQRGTELDVMFDGTRLKDAQEIIFYDKGITVTKLEALKPEQVKVHFKIAADAPLGEHNLRLRSASGISELRTFWVGPFPTTQASTKPVNTAWETPQALPMNVTVAGVIQNEQVHYYKIDAKKGQRISAEVEGMRLGTTMFDPYLELVDLAKFELATSDDTALLRQDPYISLLAPKDGPFIVAVRESAFGGNGESHYRLHVGTFPRPKVAFPLGGKVGETLNLQFIGDPSGPIAQQIKLPDQPVDEMPLYVVQNNESPPSPNYLRVSPFPNVMESGSNHDVASATAAPMEPPLAFNGIISVPKETDFFKFKGHKGQALEISVFARRLRSPLDSVIAVFDAKGQYLANNDDAGGPDSVLRFTPPADGDYIVNIRDHLSTGGPEYAYRIELTIPKPSVVLSIPNATQVNGPSQERQTIPVPRGNRYATLIRAARNGVNGDLGLSAAALPDGITMTAEPLYPIGEGTPVLFEAKADAPVAGKLCEFKVEHIDLPETVAKAAPKEATKAAAKQPAPKEPFDSELLQRVELVIGQPNNTPYSHTEVRQLAVAVTQEAPFKIDLVQPKAPLVQNGSLKIKIKAERKPDFKGVINLKMLFHPPGVNAQPVDMPGDKSEIEMPLSANEGAQIKKWRICVIGSSDVGGPLWVATQFVDLDVTAPYLTGKIQMAAAEQGAPSQVICDLTPNAAMKFDGKAKMELQGLPANASAEPKEVTASDARVIFDVVTSAKTAPGQSTSLMVQATIKKDGDDVVQSVAKAGVLRIDPPKTNAPPKPAVAAATPAPVPPPQTKTLTRLEKLRLEQTEAKTK